MGKHDGGLHTLRAKFPIKTGHAVLDWMLLAIPAALVLHWFVHPGPVLVFAAAALAIIPLAGALGEATDVLAHYIGQRWGGLLNATMGNATELIIGFFTLRAGHVEIVKASISGSIIGNALLVLGMSCIVGGLRREKQTFSRRDAAVNSTMLFIAVVALVVPAVYDLATYGRLKQNGVTIEHLSLWTSLILVLVYASSMLFTMGFGSGPSKSQKSGAEPRGPGGSESSGQGRSSSPRMAGKSDGDTPPAKSAVISLAVATVLVAYMSEILVGQLEAVKEHLGVSDLFLGVIIIAAIGNAAEHSTAVIMAARNKMDVALNIAVGSSSQIALLVAPLLVFASWFMHPHMSLVFTGLEIAGIGLAVLVLQMISYDGETNWFEGVQLVAVYLILAVAFYYVPA